MIFGWQFTSIVYGNCNVNKSHSPPRWVGHLALEFFIILP